MQINFTKYQGAGNDFILIDNRIGGVILTTSQIKMLCDRHFGIGADGLMLLETHSSLDFKMVYYNSDGNESTLCGNGGRCIVRFANDIGAIGKETHFEAIDGKHYAKVAAKTIALEMHDIHNITTGKDYSFLDTGSPHHVVFVDDVASIDVQKEGAAIRYGKLYGEEGSNVNFVQKIGDNHLFVRTYERGVEGETLACGTGVTAAAIAAHKNNLATNESVNIKTMGGNLRVDFKAGKEDLYTNIVLSGPAEKVFSGTVEI